MTYRCPLPYNPERIHAAGIYCSDGRVGLQFDDFLRNGLALPRYDRVCLPGGPACLAGHPQAHLEQQGVVDELNFLVEVHRLERVVLISHQGCAFYAARLGLDEPSLKQTQFDDLAKAAAFVRDITGLGTVDAFFAGPTTDGMRFDPVPV